MLDEGNTADHWRGIFSLSHAEPRCVYLPRPSTLGTLIMLVTTCRIPPARARASDD